jgi:hypothetical protein
MDRRTIVAIQRFDELMLTAPTKEHDPYAVTSPEELNRAWEHKDRILKVLMHVVRDAQDELARGHVAWELVRDCVSDELLAVTLDPTMLDEEALREVEIYVRNHF